MTAVEELVAEGMGMPAQVRAFAAENLIENLDVVSVRRRFWPARWSSIWTYGDAHTRSPRHDPTL